MAGTMLIAFDTTVLGLSLVKLGLLWKANGYMSNIVRVLFRESGPSRAGL